MQDGSPRISVTEQSLLEWVWRRGPIARTELADLTGLTEASVSRLTRDLLARGFLGESVSREGAKGQPKRPLTVDPTAAYAFGVYFSHRHFEIGLVDLGGNLLAHQQHPLPATSVDALATAAQRGIDDLLEQRPVPREKILGVGFSLPGDFIGDGAKINAHAYFPELMHVDLQKAMSARLPFAVFVENDGASAALGERIHGVGRRYDNFLFLHLGHGIGGGLIINGQLYRGAQGNAGIIGVQFPNDQPRPSGQDLFATLAAHAIEVADFDQLGSLSVKSCAPLQRWIQRAARQLASSLDLTVRIVDPQAVVIGGRFPPELTQELVWEIDAVGFCQEGVGLPRPKLYASSLGPRAGVIGTACLAFLQHLFSRGAATDRATR